MGFQKKKDFLLPKDPFWDRPWKLKTKEGILPELAESLGRP